MVKITNTFLGAKMNKDVTKRGVPKGEYVDMLNCRVDNDSNDGEVSKVKGTEIIGSTSLPTGSVIIGHAINGDYHYYFAVKPDNNSVIGRIDTLGGVNKVIFDNDFLNFNEDYRITDIDFIDDDINGRLFMFWVDGLNPPRKIEINQALSVNSASYYPDAGSFNIAKAPPFKEPEIRMIYDKERTQSKFIEDAFQFCYRYIYKTGETSSLSFFSKTAFFPEYAKFNFARIEYTPLVEYDDNYRPGQGEMINAFNGVEITVSGTPPHTGYDGYGIEKIEVFAKSVDSGTMYKIKTINHSQDSSYTFEWYFDDVYPALSETDAIKLNDEVPHVVGAQEIINNTILYGDYILGLDPPEVTASLTTIGQNAITNEPAIVDPSGGFIVFELPFTHYNIVVLNISMTIGTHPDFTYYKFVSIPTVRTYGETATEYVANNLDIIAAKGFTASTYSDGGIIQNFVQLTPIASMWPTGAVIYSTITRADYSGSVWTNAPYLMPNVYNEYAVAYYDNYNRTSYAVNIGSPTQDVPSPVDKPGMTTIEISSIPPSWATKFKILRRRFFEEYVTINIEDGVIDDDGRLALKVKEDNAIVVPTTGTKIKLISTQFVPVSAIDIEKEYEWSVDNPEVSDVFESRIIEVLSISDAEVGDTVQNGLWLIIEPTDQSSEWLEASDTGIAGDAEKRFKYWQLTVNVYTGTYVGDEFFRELPHTYPITSGYHVNDNIIDNTIEGSQSGVNDFVAILWHDGDVFPQEVATKYYRYKMPDTKVYSSIGRPMSESTNIKQVRYNSSIIHSTGKYITETGINETSNFNLALGNYKHYDSIHGTVEKIYSRDTDLVIFQTDKVIHQPFDKDIIYSVGGGSQITSTSNTLGTHTAYVGEFGFSHKESFAAWDKTLFWVDAKRGVIMRLDNNGLYPISDHGMKDFFFSMLKNNPSYKFLGTFNNNKKEYAVNAGDYTYFFQYKNSAWTHKQDFIPNTLIDNGLDYFSFKGTTLYRHETGATLANFYSDQKDATINFIVNEEFASKKVLKSIAIQGDAWRTSIIGDDSDEVDILISEFENKEGFKYSALPMATSSIKKGSEIGGIGNCTTSGSNASIINIPVPIHTIDVGNSVYDLSDTLIGIVVGKTDEGLIMDRSTAVADQFLYYTKNQTIEGSPLRGHIFDVTLLSEGSQDDKIFSIESEVFQSVV